MKLRYWWPLLVAVSLYIAVLAFLAGLAVATSPEPDAPFGLLEMWINRYQTLIATGLAIVTLFMGLLQVSATRAAAQKQALLTVRMELEAFDVAIQLAVSTRNSLESGAQLQPISSMMKEMVQKYGSARLWGVFNQLAVGVDGYRNRPDLRTTLAPVIKSSTELVEQIATAERDALIRILEIGD